MSTRLTASARTDWAELAAPRGGTAQFSPDMIGDLPEPAQRWLLHAIRPGTPLRSSVRLAMHGRIRMGAWWRFTATQILRPPHGFIWAADARVAGLPVTGFDRYTRGEGEMRWRLPGGVPVMSAAGPDITRSAAGRLASELVLVPSAALDPAVSWEPVDDDRVTARVAIGGQTHPVTLTIGLAGEVTAVTLPRWGAPRKGPYSEHVFGVEVYRERSFGGFTIPSMLSAGWWHGTERWKDGEFIRIILDRAKFH